ncbi:hypothetical protein BC829DRAFT_388086 [Chytridium lagenaria]|nr:hypothetical protein BC829DRAFT_388086 [Chytridium lagenaria]
MPLFFVFFCVPEPFLHISRKDGLRSPFFFCYVVLFVFFLNTKLFCLFPIILRDRCSFFFFFFGCCAFPGFRFPPHSQCFFVAVFQVCLERCFFFLLVFSRF